MSGSDEHEEASDVSMPTAASDRRDRDEEEDAESQNHPTCRMAVGVGAIYAPAGRLRGREEAGWS